MTERGSRRHLGIHLDGDAGRSLDALRAVWDPVMCEVAPPHVTLVYPEETLDADLLLERAGEESTLTSAFSISLGAITCADDGRGGVFVEVEDLDGGLETLRDRLLLPPQLYSGYPFHTTIAHPRTAPDPESCWQHLRGLTVKQSLMVREVLWTITGDDGRTVLERFPLTGPPVYPRTSMAGGVIVSEGRVLLGLRNPERASFPNVWDVPGGHVEPGESPREALRRELREELGIEAVLEHPWHRLVDEELGIELALWCIRAWSGELSNRAPEEHRQLAWCTADDLRSLRLAHPAY
ncbi:MAG: NUDIX domain-containing protein, partial [Brachybacterium sp.]|nr:NUDIX domain-containing protein [Brachybacterium sp.]